MSQQKIEQTKNTPLREFRAGGVRATIWENNHIGPNGTFTVQSVTIERRYKVGDEYKSTNNYTLSGIQKLKHVVNQAEAYLLTGEKEDGVDA